MTRLICTQISKSEWFENVIEYFELKVKQSVNFLLSKKDEILDNIKNYTIVLGKFLDNKTLELIDFYEDASKFANEHINVTVHSSQFTKGKLWNIMKILLIIGNLSLMSIVAGLVMYNIYI
jgi:hypothetical protein